jgi:hypothetical protein
MSDLEQNLEDESPAPVAEAAPVEAPLAAAPELPVEETDLNDPELLKDEQRLKAVLSETSRVRQQNRELKGKAAKADELERYVNDSRPYVEFLKANPDLLKPRQQAPAAFGTPAPQVDPQAEALAKTLDLYTPEGKPDVARATAFNQMIRSQAQQIAQQTIAPIHEQNYQTESARNFQIALTVKDAAGRSPSPASLAQIWKTMPAHQTADPNVASILALTALGLDSVSQKPQPQAPGAPLVTEGMGGNIRRPALSALEARLAKDRNMKESEWQDNTKGFVPGRAQQLED